MNEIRKLLQYTFLTQNEMTLAISGTGSAGMETCVVNLIEPGDPVLLCINGVFGKRMADVTERYHADVSTVEIDWGRAFAPQQINDALKRKQAKVVGIVHAETSTGVCQPLEEISRIWFDSWPRNESIDPAQIDYQGSRSPPTLRVLINRHGRYGNIVYFDGHAKAVYLPEYFMQKWNKSCKPNHEMVNKAPIPK
ncbi:aminotransferase class V-fold PLP-dependent enzyme [Planctomycetota bacterium]